MLELILEVFFLLYKYVRIEIYVIYVKVRLYKQPPCTFLRDKKERVYLDENTIEHLFIRHTLSAKYIEEL